MLRLVRSCLIYAPTKAALHVTGREGGSGEAGSEAAGTGMGGAGGDHGHYHRSSSGHRRRERLSLAAAQREQALITMLRSRNNRTTGSSSASSSEFGDGATTTLISRGDSAVQHRSRRSEATAHVAGQTVTTTDSDHHSRVVDHEEINNECGSAEKCDDADTVVFQRLAALDPSLAEDFLRDRKQQKRVRLALQEKRQPRQEGVQQQGENNASSSSSTLIVSPEVRLGLLRDPDALPLSLRHAHNAISSASTWTDAVAAFTQGTSSVGSGQPPTPETYELLSQALVVDRAARVLHQKKKTRENNIRKAADEETSPMVGGEEDCDGRVGLFDEQSLIGDKEGDENEMGDDPMMLLVKEISEEIGDTAAGGGVGGEPGRWAATMEDVEAFAHYLLRKQTTGSDGDGGGSASLSAANLATAVTPDGAVIVREGRDTTLGVAILRSILKQQQKHPYFNPSVATLVNVAHLDVRWIEALTAVQLSRKALRGTAPPVELYDRTMQLMTCPKTEFGSRPWAHALHLYTQVLQSGYDPLPVTVHARALSALARAAPATRNDELAASKFVWEKALAVLRVAFSEKSALAERQQDEIVTTKADASGVALRGESGVSLCESLLHLSSRLGRWTVALSTLSAMLDPSINSQRIRLCVPTVECFAYAVTACLRAGRYSTADSVRALVADGSSYTGGGGLESSSVYEWGDVQPEALAEMLHAMRHEAAHFDATSANDIVREVLIGKSNSHAQSLSHARPSSVPPTKTPKLVDRSVAAACVQLLNAVSAGQASHPSDAQYNSSDDVWWLALLAFTSFEAGLPFSAPGSKIVGGTANVSNTNSNISGDNKKFPAFAKAILRGASSSNKKKSSASSAFQALRFIRYIETTRGAGSPEALVLPEALVWATCRSTSSAHHHGGGGGSATWKDVLENWSTIVPSDGSDHVGEWETRIAPLASLRSDVAKAVAHCSSLTADPAIIAATEKPIEDQDQQNYQQSLTTQKEKVGDTSATDASTSLAGGWVHAMRCLVHQVYGGRAEAVPGDLMAKLAMHGGHRTREQTLLFASMARGGGSSVRLGRLVPHFVRVFGVSEEQAQTMVFGSKLRLARGVALRRLHGNPADEGNNAVECTQHKNIDDCDDSVVNDDEASVDDDDATNKEEQPCGGGDDEPEAASLLALRLTKRRFGGGRGSRDDDDDDDCNDASMD